MVEPILHITGRAQWEQARAAGAYRGDTLATEGFIHCSTPAQVLGPADALFRGRDDLVLLAIDPTKVGPEIRYEGLPGGEQFPHVYGPLNLDAVTRVVPFPPRPDGTFALPTDLTV
jgi:uncharacterized protein (DUF952 family)